MFYRCVLFAGLLLTGLPLFAAPLQVVVSIGPQKNLVERVGGEHVAVMVMVRSGQSPATYEPTLKQMAQLTQADLYYRIGVPFEQKWIDRIYQTNPKMARLDAREGIPLREWSDDKDHDHDHRHGHEDEPIKASHDKDPHTWLSPLLAIEMASALRDQLMRMDPSHALDFENNYTVLASELMQLHQEIKQQLAQLHSRDLWVFHPSWGYFADTYGLHQISIQQDGHEPSARTLARHVKKARASGGGIIFIQPQFSQTQAIGFAKEVGMRVVTVDPLAEDYPENLRRAARAIAKGAH